MGVRAFGTQLPCEQVVGRGLRRVSYEIDPATGLFPVEYADVLGVPFTFAQQGKKVAPKPPPKVTRVRAIEERAALEIRFPNVVGYRVVFPRKPLRPTFTYDSEMPLNTDDIPVRTEIEPLIGEGFTIDLRRNADQLREKTVIFDVAGLLLRTYFIDEDGALQVWRYPELVRITERWFKECLKCSGGTLPQFLKWRSLAIRAVEKIYRSLAPSLSGPPDASDGALMPILNAYNPEGTTKYVDFPTTKTTLFATRPDRRHLNTSCMTQPSPLSHSGEGPGVRATDRGRERAMATEPHEFARRLRKSSTKYEDFLWARLRGSRLRGAKFKRQVPVDRYVVDFYCHAARLAVEVDGAQHGWYAEYDADRTKALESAGLHVIRFTNDEIRDDLDDALRRIGAALRLPFA